MSVRYTTWGRPRFVLLMLLVVWGVLFAALTAIAWGVVYG